MLTTLYLIPSLLDRERALEEALASLFHGEPVTALTSGPAYPATLYPGPFGLVRGC